MVHGKLHSITDKKGAELLSTELCLTTPTKWRGHVWCCVLRNSGDGSVGYRVGQALDDAAEVACAVNPVVATTAEKHGLPGGGLLRFRPTGDSQVIVSQELQATDLCRGSAHHYLGY